MLLHRFMGDVELLGDRLLAYPLVAAKDVDIFLAGREHVHRLFDQLAGVDRQVFSAGQCLLQHRYFPFLLPVLFPGYLFETVEGMVTRHHHQVGFKAFHLGQGSPVRPYFKENVLYYFLCKLVRFSNTKDKIAKLVIVRFKKPGEGLLISFRYA